METNRADVMGGAPPLRAGRFGIRYEDLRSLANGVYRAYAQQVARQGNRAVATRELLEAIKLAAWWLSAPTWPRRIPSALLLTGTVGTGKTTLAKALGAIYHRAPERAAAGEFGNPLAHDTKLKTFWRAVDLYREYDPEQTVRYVPSADGRRFQEVAHHRGLLVIDELGGEEPSYNHFGVHHYPLVDLIDIRSQGWSHPDLGYQYPYCTVFTSNLDLEALKGRYGVRTWDRLRGMCGVINMRAASFRNPAEFARGEWPDRVEL